MSDDVNWGEAQEPETGPKLIPDELPDVERTTVELKFLPADEDLMSPPPTRDLIHSMNVFGLMQPVVIGVAEGSPFSPVYGGRRRVKAARALGWEEIDAWRVTSDDQAAVVETLTIALNATAKANPAAELQSIERLIVEEGANEKDVAAATGLKVGTIRARMRLMSLIPPLRRALERGKLSAGNAEIAARLSGDRQANLARIYEENGKVTGKDVDGERRRKVAAATDAFDMDDLDTPAASALQSVGDATDDAAGGADPAANRYNPAGLNEEDAAAWAASMTEKARVLRAAVAHLEARAESACAVERPKRPKWSNEDCAAVRVVLAALA